MYRQTRLCDIVDDYNAKIQSFKAKGRQVAPQSLFWLRISIENMRNDLALKNAFPTKIYIKY